MKAFVLFSCAFLLLGLPLSAEEPKQLRGDGNRLVEADDPTKTVRLAGMNIPGFEWSNNGEHAAESVAEAAGNWNGNVIRVPMSVARWYGCEQWQNNPDGYRENIDRVVKDAVSRGLYVILDCHWSNGGQGDVIRRPGIKNTEKARKINGQKKMPDREVVDFWLDLVRLYGNHPAVMFNLYNEPHGVSWEVWRNGGPVKEKLFDLDSGKHEEKEYEAVGHQQLVEAIRGAGAKNILVVGGLDWAYDLRGVVGEAKNDPKDYSLVDCGPESDQSKSGFGIIYDTHIYPWKGGIRNWETCVGGARKKFPILAGECGWDWDTIRVIRPSTNLEKEPHLDHPRWVPELLDWFDLETSRIGTEFGNQVHWTGWCFHPKASPRLLVDWTYEPTPFWGRYVKERLLSYGDR